MFICAGGGLHTSPQIICLKGVNRGVRSREGVTSHTCYTSFNITLITFHFKQFLLAAALSCDHIKRDVQVTKPPPFYNKKKSYH